MTIFLYACSGKKWQSHEGFRAEMHASDAVLGSVGRWLLLHQTLTSASGVPSAVARVGERASDALLQLRQTLDVSIRSERRQPLRMASTALDAECV
jgi:hypothetical protein